MLGSPVFVRARRSSQLLRFLVETKLAGGDPRLKEYSIATDVFGRPESFDPRLDSLVRVEATRLRNRLESYYESVGKSALIEITVPIGTYTPGFHWRTTESSSSTPEPDEVATQPLPSRPALHAPRRLGLFRLATLALALVCISAGGLILNGRLWEGRSSGLVLLQHFGNPGEVLLSPSLTPDSRSIYYASNRGGSRLRIWRQSLRGNDAQAITSAQWDSYDLDLSPDGTWLAYYSNREGGGVYQKAMSGKPEVLIASLGRSPRFSPDGKQVLYWVQDAHTGFGSVFTRLVRREPEPEEPRRVAGEFQDAHNPQWTPDGRILLCGTLRTNV